MATQYTRIYTFTGQRNTRSRRNVAWTRFTVSGDTTHRIGQIVSIVYEHYHTSTEKPTWTLKGRLICSDGSYIDSNTQSHKFNSDLYKYSNTFATVPSAEKFAMITAVQTIANETAEPTSTSGGDLYWRATATEPMKVIITFVEEPPVHYGPKVNAFALTRVDSNGVPNNEGVYLRMDVKLSLVNTANKNNSTVRIYYGTEPTIDTSAAPHFTPNLTIDQMLSGIYGNTQAVPVTFSNGSKWYFALVFTCGGETAVGGASVGRALTTLCVSTPTGSVAIGGFSTGTEGNPKFESYPPAYFYGGIAQIGDGSQDIFNVVGIQAGNVAGETSTSGITKDYTVKFEKPYATPPVVVVGMQIGGRYATSYYMGRVSIALISVSTTEFVVRSYNVTENGNEVNIGFTWAAFGKMA